jgi:hypothetical protein
VIRALTIRAVAIRLWKVRKFGEREPLTQTEITAPLF